MSRRRDFSTPEEFGTLEYFECFEDFRDYLLIQKTRKGYSLSFYFKGCSKELTFKSKNYLSRCPPRTRSESF